VWGGILVVEAMDKSSGSGGGAMVSDAIKDFVFDLHDATRRSFRVEDVQQLYDLRFKVCFSRTSLRHLSAPLNSFRKSLINIYPMPCGPVRSKSPVNAMRIKYFFSSIASSLCAISLPNKNTFK
jgi:hypothetical protein